MKKTKLFSVVMACTMAVSMAGSIAVSADEYQEGLKFPEEYQEGLKSPYSENGNYVFEYLNTLTKEEFFALDGAEELYNEVVSDVVNNQMMKYDFFASTNTDERYTWYKSEKELKILFDGIDGFDITSPLLNSDVFYDNYVFAFSNDEILSGIKVGEEAISQVTEDDYLYFAKTWYCLNQVANFSFLNGRMLDSTGIARGDVNDDGKFDIRDAAFIARTLAQPDSETLPKTADINGDGEPDIRDAAFTARFFAAKGAAKAEGFIN